MFNWILQKLPKNLYSHFIISTETRGLFVLYFFTIGRKIKGSLERKNWQKSKWKIIIAWSRRNKKQLIAVLHCTMEKKLFSRLPKASFILWKYLASLLHMLLSFGFMKKRGGIFCFLCYLRCLWKSKISSFRKYKKEHFEDF